MAPSVTASSDSQRQRRTGTDDPVARLLASGQARTLLQGPEAPATAGRLAAELRRRGRSRCRRVGGLVCKAILLYALYNVSSHIFFGELPAVWQFVQNTESFARAELVYNQLARRISVGLGLHGYDSLHAMERMQCMLPNPMYTAPLLCCPCDKFKLIKAASAAALHKGFDQLFDRMVSPFVYSNNSQPELDYPALRAIVTSHWGTIDYGPNRVGALLLPSGPHSEASAPSTLEQLFRPNDAKPPTAPPPDSATYWLFGHLPAIRALRDAVRRPDHVPQLAEDVFARQFVFLGNQLPVDVSVPLGDMQIVRGLAHAFVLHGEATITLALKPTCCPKEVSRPSYRNITQHLRPGQVLVFMSDCYWVSAAKTSGWPGYVVLHFGAVYNGLHPIESSGARPGKRRKTAEKTGKIGKDETTVKDKTIGKDTKVVKDKKVGKDEKIAGKDEAAVKDKKFGKDEKHEKDMKVGQTGK